MNARFGLFVVATASVVVGVALSSLGSLSRAATVSGSSWIVYSEGKGPTVGTHGLRLLNVNTGVQRPLARNRYARRASWSPNGKRMVFEDAGVRVEKAGYRDPPGATPEISVISLRSGSIHRLTHSLAYEEFPAWSPNGRRIAFLRSLTRDGTHDGIWLVNASGGSARQLTQNAGDFCPRWSPDGRQIAFVHYISDSATRDLWLMQSDGTGQHLLVPHSSCAAWSPDGRQLAIDQLTGRTATSCRCLVTDLYLSDTSGAQLRLLIRNGGSATWSPDGKRIVFVRWAGGRTHLWMINTDGTGLRQLTHGRKSQASPVWRPRPKP